MFGRSILRRAAAGGKHRQHADKESDRIYRERQRRILYDAQGNLQLSGLAFLLWEDFRKPVGALVGVLGLFYGYNKLLVYLSASDNEKISELDGESEAYARQSGKLKADRYLVKPMRQIDDPDFLNIPSYGGKGVYESKLFKDDTTSSGPKHSERNRS